MNLKEIEQVFNTLKKFGIYIVLIQGGEPLVRKDFLDIVSILNELRFKLIIISNGILLSEKILGKLDRLNTYNNISVSVSLDSLDREVYRKIRSVDCLNKVLENIKNLSRHKGLHGAIGTTITSINYDEMEKIHDFVSHLKLDHKIRTYNHSINYAAQSNSDLELTKKDELEKIIKELQKIRNRLSYVNRLYLSENIKYLRGEDVGSCDAFKYSLRVTAEGKLSPCVGMPPFFDLKSNDINHHWRDLYKKMKNNIRGCYSSTPCFYGCTRLVGSLKKGMLRFRF